MFVVSTISDDDEKEKNPDFVSRNPSLFPFAMSTGCKGRNYFLIRKLLTTNFCKTFKYVGTTEAKPI